MDWSASPEDSMDTRQTSNKPGFSEFFKEHFGSSGLPSFCPFKTKKYNALNQFSCCADDTDGFDGEVKALPGAVPVSPEPGTLSKALKIQIMKLKTKKCPPSVAFDSTEPGIKLLQAKESELNDNNLTIIMTSEVNNYSNELPDKMLSQLRADVPDKATAGKKLSANISELWKKINGSKSHSSEVLYEKTKDELTRFLQQVLQWAHGECADNTSYPAEVLEALNDIEQIIPDLATQRAADFTDINITLDTQGSSSPKCCSDPPKKRVTHKLITALIIKIAAKAPQKYRHELAADDVTGVIRRLSDKVQREVNIDDSALGTIEDRVTQINKALVKYLLKKFGSVKNLLRAVMASDDTAVADAIVNYLNVYQDNEFVQLSHGESNQSFG